MSAFYGSGSALALNNIGASSGGGGVYDVIGIGFGASALGVAIAFAEHNQSILSPMSIRNKGTPARRSKSFTALGGLQTSLRDETDPKAPVEEPDSPENVLQPEELAAPTDRKLTCCFLDQNPGFQWHSGMMLEGSRMQISFLKDLVTMRNPMSPYSFLAYLHSHSQSRLASFISLSTFTPSRTEFADYLRWAARKVKAELEEDGGAVVYGERVIAIQAVLLDSYAGTEREDVRLVRVTTENVLTGATSIRFARNIAISTGGTPQMPPFFEGIADSKEGFILHSAHYLHTAPLYLQEILVNAPVTSGGFFRPYDDADESARNLKREASLAYEQGRTQLASSGPSAPRVPRRKAINVQLGGEDVQKSHHLRIAVVGGGQSAAEVFLNLNSAIGSLMSEKDFSCDIHLFFRGSALKPADSSAFTNEVFDPGMAEATYNLDHAHRMRLLNDIRDSNYSVVNEVTLHKIYEALYDQRMTQDLKDDPFPERYARRPVLRVTPCHELVDAQLVDDSSSILPEGKQPMKLWFRNTMTESVNTFTYDMVVSCTGYRHDVWKSLLGLDNIQALREDAVAQPSQYSSAHSSRKPSFNDANGNNNASLMQDPRACQDIGTVSLAEVFALPPPKVLPEKRTAASLSLYTQVPPQSAQPQQQQSTSSPTVGNRKMSMSKRLALAQFTQMNSMTSATPPSTSPAISRNPSGDSIAVDSSAISDVDESDAAADADNAESTVSDFQVREDYRIQIPSMFRVNSRSGSTKAGRFCPTFWLQGGSEETHGITESLLSVIAVRSGDLVSSILRDGYFGDEQVSNAPSRRGSMSAGGAAMPGLVSRRGSISSGMAALSHQAKPQRKI